jgi:hypothetical protein
VLGRGFYWVIEWIVALPWTLIERAKGLGTNLPWPTGQRRELRDEPPREWLLVIPKDSSAGAALAGMLGPDNDTVVQDEALDSLPTETLAAAY